MSGEPPSIPHAGRLDVTAAVECTLFAEDSAPRASLDKPQGFLFFRANERDPVQWQIAPLGELAGLRFELHRTGERAERTRARDRGPRFAW